MTDSYSTVRRFPRIPMRCVMVISRIEERSCPAQTRTRSIGLGGCSFEYDQALDEGVPIRLFLAIGYSSIRVQAKVVYSRELENGRYEVGVEFCDVSDADLRSIARFFDWKNPKAVGD